MNIIGTGSALPVKSVTNDQLAAFLDTSDEWISTRTGIRSRRILSSDRLEDLAADASRKALEMSGLKPEDIDFVICSNVANNHVTPGLACLVENAIGLSCPCIDINAGCTGFMYAIDYAEAYLETNRAKNILIVCAEEPTRYCDWHTREATVLFADGAGAVVVTKGDGLLSNLVTFTPGAADLITYSRRMEFTPFETTGVETTKPLVLKGREVFRNAVMASKRDLDTVLDKAGLKAEDVTYFLLHQANLRIVNSIMDQFKLDESRFLNNIEDHGNTSSASLPILIDEMHHAGKFKKGDVIALSAFGSGFVTGAALFRWVL